MERLTARTENGNAYLVNVKPDEQEVESPYKNTLQCILDCFERLAQYEDAEEQGLLVRLPCKVGEIIDKYNELTKPMAEAPEDYTTGYKNGHRNGQTELIAYLFQIDTGARAEAETALKGGKP